MPVIMDAGFMIFNIRATRVTIVAILAAIEKGSIDGGLRCDFERFEGLFP